MPEGTVLAFDFGEKRIGVAIGEKELNQAHPLAVIRVRDETQRNKSIDALIREWQPGQLVVGLPAHLDGTPHAMTALCQRFAAGLAEFFHLPVALVDERLTSADAESRLRESGHNAKTMKPLLDAVAAQLILQTWFDSHVPIAKFPT